MTVAFESKDQEDEHSCFSDNTNADVVNDLRGIRMVYTGAGPGDDAADPAEPQRRSCERPIRSWPATVSEALDASLAKAQSFPAPFETMIAAPKASPADTAHGGRDRGDRGADRLLEEAAEASTSSELRGLTRCAGPSWGSPPARSLAAPRRLRRQSTAAGAPRDRAQSGGDAAPSTTPPASRSRSALETLTAEDRRAFAVGNSFFNHNWVRAPASTTGRDGLGPTFNAQSCSSCHLHDGRGRPPADERRPRARAAAAPQRPGDGRRSRSRPSTAPAAGPRDRRRAGRGTVAHPHDAGRRALRRRHAVHAARAALHDRRPRVRAARRRAC